MYFLFGVDEESINKDKYYKIVTKCIHKKIRISFAQQFDPLSAK